MLKCKIEGRNLENGSEKYYDISEGAVFTENYNETLDSGTILIQQLSGEIEIEPYDVVVIESYGGGLNIVTRRMCVDAYTCTQTSLNPPIYRYEISLFSETKLLETVICPNLAITKLASGTPRDVLTYLDRYLKLFAPKTDSSPLAGAFDPAWTVSDAVTYRFTGVQCPEMQWNQPTLREVLTDLMMVDDCIPVLKNGKLYYIDISSVGSNLTPTEQQYINYITKSHSSEDYVSDIKMHLVNAANNSVPDGTVLPKDTTRVVERIGFRNDESYLLTTENMRLQTSFPIWKLFYCKIYFTLTVAFTYTVSKAGHSADVVTSVSSDGSRILKDTSVDYIPEYQEWLTKDVYYGAWSLGSTDINTQYRNTCLYYVRGGKNIDNFNAKVEYQFLWIQNSLYVWEMIANSPENAAIAQSIAQAEVDRMQENDPEGRYTLKEGSVSYTMGSFKEATFELEYEAIDDCVFSASKMPFKRNHRQIIDNQTNSYIDVNRQGMLEYLKANRLGNKMISVNGRFTTNELLIPGLGRKINDHIVFQRQISVYDKHIDANFLATENYVLRNYFTGVKSKIRSWPIVSGSDALTRAELVKFYVNSQLSQISNATRKIPVYADLDTYLEKFKYCAMRFDGVRPGDTDYAGTSYATNAVMVEFTKHKVGSSVVFTVKMQDNRYVGNYVSNYNGTDGRVEQKGIGYTDANGEMTDCVICFYSDCTPLGFPSEEASRALKPLVSADLAPLQTGGLILTSANLEARIPVKVHKDNKETLQVSIQFEWNEYANDIFLGKR